MLCSEARLAANRRNATKSTGPRTSEGKARSSRNALKHGFCATGSSLTPLEDKEAYDAYTAAITDSLRPGTPLEEDLARRIADLSWRLRRIPDAESALLARDTVHDLAHRCASPCKGEDDDHDEHDDHEEHEHVAPDSPARLLASVMSAPQNPYLTLQRYEQSLDRARSRALKELRQLQKDRRQFAVGAEEAHLPNEPTSSSVCSVSSVAEPQPSEVRNEPTTPAAPTADPSRPLRALAPSRLPQPDLRNEPNPLFSVSRLSSVAEQTPQSQMANQNSQFQRAPQRFILKPSDLRPLPSPAPI